MNLVLNITRISMYTVHMRNVVYVYKTWVKVLNYIPIYTFVVYMYVPINIWLCIAYIVIVVEQMLM